LTLFTKPGKTLAWEVILLRLHEIIVKDAMLLDLASRSRDKAMAELTSALHEAGRLSDVNQVLAEVEARESQRRTGIGGGISIPRATISSLHQPMIAIGRSKKGIDFNATDGKPVQVIFLLLTPETGQSVSLKILARLDHLRSKPRFIDGFLNADSASDVLKLIKGLERPLGEIEPPEDLPRVCVAGAGSGGLAMAAHLALLGCHVNLFNRSEGRLEAIRMTGGIEAAGEVTGRTSLNVVTTDPEQALKGVDIVMVVIPASGHQDMARLLGPHLVDGQVVVLNPGRTGGALEFTEVLRKIKMRTFPLIAEAQTMLYACRVTNPAQVRIFRIKNMVPVASIPAYSIPEIVQTMNKVLPQFVPGDSVLKTSLDNVGSIFHPALTLLNAGWIKDRHGDFEFYHEGASRSVSKVLEAMDEERVAVAAALGLRAQSAQQWLYMAYGAAGKDLYESLQANPGYRGIRAPKSLDHRYIAEEVPMSLVPLASFGDHVGVPVPTIKAFIQLACALTGRNFFTEGRTIERLGLAGLSIQQIRSMVVTGRIRLKGKA